MKRVIPVLGALLSTAVIFLIAADRPATCPCPAPAKEAAQPKLIQQVYSVADLIIPIPGCPVEATKKDEAVCPAGCCAGMACCLHACTAGRTQEDTLMKLITSTIAPQCWSEVGGPCSVDYFPIGTALVVSAPADVQEQVADLLAALRRLMDVEVAVELRLVTVSDMELMRNFGLPALNVAAVPNKYCGAGQDCAILYGHYIPTKVCEHACPAEGCGECCPYCETLTVMPRPEMPPCTFLSDCQMFHLMEMIQGDRRSSVMAAPKITMLNGQCSCVQCLDQPTYVVGVDFTEVNGQTIMKPTSKSIALGFQFDLHPVVSADQHSVLLDLHMQQHSLVSEEIPLIPVTYFITPKHADGHEGPAVPFTQFIQQPRVNHLDVSITKSIPDGQTLVVYCGQQEHETRWETGPPILSKIPYVNRLFKRTGYSTETQHVLLLVTPRVFVNSETEAKSCPGKCCEKDCQCCDKCCKKKAEAAAVSHEKECKCCGKECKCCDKCCDKKPVAVDFALPSPCPRMTAAMSPQEQRNEKMSMKALEKYHAAVQAGDLEKAREFAMEALDLDPACFHKHMGTSAAVHPRPCPPGATWAPAVPGCPLPAGIIAVQLPDGTVHAVPGSGPIPPPPAPPATALPTPALAPGYMPLPTQPPIRYLPAPPCVPPPLPAGPVPPCYVPAGFPVGVVPPPPAPVLGLPAPTMPIYPQLPTMPIYPQPFVPAGVVPAGLPPYSEVPPPPVPVEEPPAKSSGWFWNTRLGRLLSGEPKSSYSPDSSTRMNQLPNQSEDIRQIHEESRIWIQDHPPNPTPERIHGGIK